MQGARKAFPLLELPSVDKTHLIEITDHLLPKVRDVLQKRLTTTDTIRVTDSGTLSCTYGVGSTIRIPLTFVGSPADNVSGAPQDEQVLVHSPGLAGAFAIPLSELTAARGRFAASAGEENQLGTLCLLQALRGARGCCVLDRLYRTARRRHFSVVGMERLLREGGQINSEALQLTFPYHCGGEQAVRRFLDPTPEACSLFTPCRGPPEATLHGTKVLTRYGIATSVGVVASGESLQVPSLLWHPSGAPAACLAPFLHGAALLPVGHHKLAYNGPTPTCDVLKREDPRLYMKDGLVDTTSWLTEGLFGATPGSAWRGGNEASGWTVLGVGYSAADGEMDLYVSHDATGEVRPVDDVREQ